MTLYHLCFSPTGGTGKAGNLVCSAWDTPAVYIDLCDASADSGSYAFKPDDVCVVSVPSFGGRVPAAAAERLSHARGGNARAVLAAVYGNREFDDTLAELQDILTGADFRVSAAVAAVAEHSIIRQFGSGRPDAEDEAELVSFSRQIRDVLERTGETAVPAIPGNRPYRDYSGVPFKPAAGKECVACGLCAQKCPVGAIPAESPRETDSGKCISCMRCVAVCPRHARGLNKLMLAAASLKMKKACESRKDNRLFLDSISHVQSN